MTQRPPDVSQRVAGPDDDATGGVPLHVTPSSPTLPRRFPNRERTMIIASLRARAREMRMRASEQGWAARRRCDDLAARFDALADRIRDGGPLSQQIYYGIRVPLRERRDQREDRNT